MIAGLHLKDLAKNFSKTERLKSGDSITRRISISLNRNKNLNSIKDDSPILQRHFEINTGLEENNETISKEIMLNILKTQKQLIKKVHNLYFFLFLNENKFLNTRKNIKKPFIYFINILGIRIELNLQTQR